MLSFHALSEVKTGSLVLVVAGLATLSAAMVSRGAPTTIDVSEHEQCVVDANPVPIRESRDASQDDGDNSGHADGEPVYVGLARVGIATNVRGQVENDVILEMAVREVVETLFVFVDDTDTDAHTSANHVSSLHNDAWDLACVHHKQHVKINIVVASRAHQTWQDLLYRLDLGAVYCVCSSIDCTTKWILRPGLLPVAYRSPELNLRRFSQPGMTYFGDKVHGASRYAVIIVQGTFDHLHNGHRRLLSLAAGVCSERLVVGITAAPQLLAAKPFAKLIEPLETRKRKVREFVASIRTDISVEFVDVHDRLGPAATWEDSRTLVVISTSDIDLWEATVAQRLTNSLFVRVVRRSHRATLSSSRIREALAMATQ